MTAAGAVIPDSLVDWVNAPKPGCGVRILLEEGWVLHEYPVLAARVRSAAAQLARAGVRHGDIVAICEPDPLGFISAFFGTLYAGATPAPMPPRSPKPSELLDHIVGVLRLIEPQAIVAGAEVDELVRTVAASAGTAAKRLVLSDDPLDTWPSQPLAEVGLLQFTSGSTGPARGIRVTHQNLQAQATSLCQWHRHGPDDAFVSWLPLHHDMGLAGLLLAAILAQLNLWQMRPEQFLLNPVAWLECLGDRGASITAAPTFGYGYVARRVEAAQLQGLDFSGVRSAIVGAERLAPAPLRSFIELLAPFGLRATAMRPAYGLAEATLAVTGSDMTQSPRIVQVDWAAAQTNKALPVSSTATLVSGARPAPGALVSSGRPLDGVAVRILDEEGLAVPEGHLGEITVSGPSVAAGYLGDWAKTSTRFTDNALRTGDAGFMLAGELVVVGRIADSIKFRGRRVYAESIEQRIAADSAISVHRCVAIPTAKDGEDRLTILIEEPPADLHVDDVRRSVRAITGPSLDVVLVVVDRGTIARTTSGKVRRRYMWQQLHDGALSSRAIRVAGNTEPNLEGERA